MINNKIFVIILFYASIFSSDFNTETQNILESLHQNDLWILEKITEDSLYIYSKRIEGMDLLAFRADKKVIVDPMEIINVISDVGNYENFITNSGVLKTEELQQINGYLDAYQHITINLPFFSNRDYFFRMIANQNALYNNKLIEWYLLDLNDIEKNDLIRKDNNAIYLDYGAGMWLSKPINNQEFYISYRLIMDLGGYIPDILVEKINEIALVNLFKDVLKEALSRKMN